ncbi:hypothetical protein BN946_scf184760.g18 [Trametes cinnabarina]|uniref:Uncharacterized protein n=1 Tax=Pycnoporus cinnabarinus TaxID=5643 RepID=A0A060S262_PYCCI|nr:hypothetical protein BN946_scf184760.g18 [Trametes cinnabarina]
MKDNEEDAAEALPVVADTAQANAHNASEVVLAEEPVNDPATEHTADIAIYPAPQLTILTDAPVQTPSASSESEDALRPKDGDARMNLTGVVLPWPIDSAGVPADAAIQPPPSSSFEVCDKLESVSCDLLHDRISFLSQDNDSFWLKDDEVLDTDATPAECAISLSPDDSFGEKDMSLECIAPGALFLVHDSDGEQDMSMELIEHEALFFSNDLFWAPQGDAGPTPASPSTLQFDLIAEKTEESPVCRIRAPLNDPRVLVPSAADTAEPVAGSSFSSRSSPLAEVASRSCEFEVGRTTEDISKGARRSAFPPPLRPRR